MMLPSTLCKFQVASPAISLCPAGFGTKVSCGTHDVRSSCGARRIRHPRGLRQVEGRVQLLLPSWFIAGTAFGGVGGDVFDLRGSLVQVWRCFNPA